MNPKEISAINEFLNPRVDWRYITLPLVANIDAVQNGPSSTGPMDADREAAATETLSRIGERQQQWMDYREANRRGWRGVWCRFRD